MKKILLTVLILISLASIAFQFLRTPVENYLNQNQVAGLKITAFPAADVYLDNIKVGKTDYEDDKLEPRQYLVGLKAGDSQWQGKVTLKAGTITVINRELGKDLASSSGEILTLEKGSGVTVISNPDGANVDIDGQSFGKTPNRFTVSPGDHVFVLSHDNYLNRSIKASVPAGYNLNLEVDLSLTEIDLAVSSPSDQTPKVVVKATPTGFLRVRDQPSLNGLEIERVDTGTELVLLEETNSNWDKVRLSDGKEGYVSSIYVSKQ